MKQNKDTASGDSSLVSRYLCFNVKLAMPGSRVERPFGVYVRWVSKEVA